MDLLDDRTRLNDRYYTERFVKVLRSHLGKRRDSGRRPLFVFSCGGEEGPEHPARADLKSYINTSGQQSLDNVICLKAEVIAEDDVFGGWDLLTQEAVIADVADWLIIFAESPGSIAELGAFASLPHIRSITSVAVHRRYEGDQSFLAKGPVETIIHEGKPLSKVFYLDLMCPIASDEFTVFVNTLRDRVRKSELASVNRGRKKINTDETSIILGSLVHELLDLVFLCSPIDEEDLIDLYCMVKGFIRKRLTIRSRTLTYDMRKGLAGRMSVEQVISFMISSGILSSIADHRTGRRLLSCNVMLHDFFMFKSSGRDELSDLRKGMVLDKRRDGVGAAFYCR